VAGNYTHTFKTPDGCDSTVTLHLTTYAIERDETVTICKGSSYLFGGNELRKAGKYKHTFKTPEGCDSTVTLILQVEEIHSIVNESICQGSSFLFGDTLLKEPGNYKRTFKTPEGCDSTVYLRLTTYPISATIFDTICQGQEYHFNDTVYTKSGIYKQVSKTAGGCDSTTILRLTVTRPGTPTVIPITICKGDSTTYNGHIFSKVGSFRDTLTDQAGCDSFIVYKVSYGYQHDTAFVYRTCVDKPVQIINGEWMSRDTTFTTLMEFDNYECKVKTRITVIAVPSVHLDDTTFLLCGKHHLSVHLDSIPATKYQWEPTTGVACPTCSNTDVVFRGDSVSYQVSLDNGYCQDTLNVGIVTTPSPIITAAGVNQSGEGLVILVSNGTEPYYYQIDSLGDWHNNIDFEKLDIGVHMAYVKDDKGCIAKKRFSYYVPVIPAKVVTPNGDGILDRWEIKNLELYDEYTIEIYNRWGKCLKTYHNYYDGWDGTYNGHPMPSTDYWYRIVVQLNDQEETGHFTLIRF
jgi:gliding motility-associated-like protein